MLHLTRGMDMLSINRRIFADHVCEIYERIFVM